MYILDITLQRLSLFSNSELNISVAPWSSFYVFKDTLSTKQPIADVFEIHVCKIWRPSTLLKRDSNTGALLWILQNFYEQLFCRTPPLAASPLNFTLYFQAVNSGCTIIWISELLFTWIDTSCSFICIFIFEIFSSHVGILVLVGSFASNKFDEIEHVLFVQNLIKLIWSNKKCFKFYCIHYLIYLIQ